MVRESSKVTYQKAQEDGYVCGSASENFDAFSIANTSGSTRSFVYKFKYV